MEIGKFPNAIRMMAGIEENETAINRLGVFVLSNPDIYKEIAGLFREKCIGLFRENYCCAEKWTLQGVSGYGSFISFGVGERIKRQEKLIDEELNDFLCQKRKSGEKDLAVYYCTNGNKERHIIITTITCPQV
ncbi:MAG: hypothetical protein L7H18_00320 [Candidatus Nealsonbacteria bacterium DGGOD1a]|jgi:hypothetical protein|nr:MAG: hypothetical protein L7H18_00320 [Candidatus Nealsonbacteria bacterium DGGOD1a]